MAGLADRVPLLVAVDDAHWADAASLRFFEYLSRRLEGLAIALVVAVRRGEPGSAPETLVRLAAGAQERVLRPAALSVRASAALVRDSFADEHVPGPLVRACHESTRGNPLALRELLNALRQAGVGAREVSESLVREVGGRAVTHGVERRLARVAPEAVELARAAAVGDVGGLEVVAALAGLDPDRTARDARALADADLLRSPDGADFVHPLAREALLASVSPRRRDALARVAARSLVDAGRTEAAAARLLAARPAGEPWTVEVLVRAAQEARARGAPEVAATLARRALDEPPPEALLCEARTALGLAELALGRLEASQTLAGAMAAAPDARQRAAIAAPLAQGIVHQVRIREAAEVLERAVGELRAEAAGPADAALADELEAHMLLHATWEPALRATVVERLAALESRPSASQLAQRLKLTAASLEAVSACRPVGEGAALAERALAGGVLFARAPEMAMVAVNLLAVAGRPELARRHLEVMIGRFRALGARPTLRASIGLRGHVAFMEGDVLVAETDGWAMLDLAAEGEMGAPYLLASLIEALLAQGRVDAAAHELERSGLTGPLPDIAPLNIILYARGRVRIAQEEPHAGLDDLLLCGERQEGVGQRNPGFMAWRGAAATVLLELGRVEEARTLSAEEVALARDFGAPHVLGAALRVRARTVGGEAGLAMLREALALLDGSFARLQLAQVLTDLGATLLEGGQRAQARGTLATAVGLAQELSASALAEDATALLLQAGGRPRRTARRGAEALTPAERRVAELAAGGMTNREIAQALFVTEKTVETHLRRCYRKLDVGSRAQLSSALGMTLGGAFHERPSPATTVADP